MGGVVLGGYLAGCNNRSDGTDTPQQDGSTTEPTPSESPEPPRETTPGTKSSQTTKSTPQLTTAPETPTCEAMDIPQPESNTTGGIEPAEYPSFPDSLTEETIGEFVVEFETVFRRNMYVAENPDGNAPGLTVDAGVVEIFESNDTFIVAVLGDMATGGIQTTIPGTETPEPYAYLDLPFATWYEITDHQVRRVKAGAQFSEPLDPPSFEDSPTVLCPQDH